MNIRAALIAIISFTLINIQPLQASQASGQADQGNQFNWKQQLGLTAEQDKKIKEIKDTSIDDMKELRVKKWDIYKQMVMMSQHKNIDEAKLNTLLSNMNTVSAELMRQEIKMKNAIYNTLNPGQQAKMDVLMKKRLKELEKVYAQ